MRQDFCAKHQLGKHCKYADAWLLKTREPFLRARFAADDAKPLPAVHVGDTKVGLPTLARRLEYI